MPDSPNQLEEIQKQLEEYFTSHPLISVKPTKGTPPEQYELVYTISGMSKNGDGEIVESIDHVVEIAIPFGFPHFPPSCKPKSDIYHPDFDPAAICLGDFWDQDRSLAELIIYIGKMINGESYTTENAFNEEAAAWYQENGQKFPFKKIQWEIGNGPTLAAGDQIGEIDTLDDTDLNTEFDFLAMENEGSEEDIILNTSFPEVDSSSDIDLALFNQLKRQNKFYTLLRTGEDLSSSSAELADLCREAKARIKEAEKLHREAKKFESKGSARIALEKYQKVTSIVTDFPVIDADIRRVEQTLTLLEDINSDTEPDLFEPEIAEEKIVPPSLTKPEVPPEKKDRPKIETSKKQLQEKKSSADEFFPVKRGKQKIILLAGLIAVALVLGGYFWYSFSNRLNRAEEAYAHCSTAYANEQFQTAKKSCETALQLVKTVKFVHGDFARQLEQFILEILKSERLSQGLAGNVLFDGRYIPRAEAETLHEIQKLQKEADARFDEEKWQTAHELYRNLTSRIEGNSYVDKAFTEELNRKRLISEFRLSYDPAQKLMKKRAWEDAIDKLLQAQQILVSLPEGDRERYSEELQSNLQKCQFANLKEQGDLSFTSADWLKAIASYNLALTRGQEASLPPDSIEAIRNNIKRAELYTKINRGNKAFASGDWDQAILEYSGASRLLVSSRRVPYEKESDMNVQKLARIILQATIIGDRQTIQALIKDQELEQARLSYLQIAADIDKSPFAGEHDFKVVKDELNGAVRSLNKEIFLKEKIQYLKDNYQSLFVANYPYAIPDRLTNPVVNKTREVGSKLVFRMQCTETGGTRPLILVMHYAYDTVTGAWHLFSQ